MAAISLGPSPSRRDVLAKRIRLLAAATITYNVIEAVVAITAGTLASSTALIGFGLDSAIEVSSATAVAWQFSAADHAVREARAAHPADHRGRSGSRRGRSTARDRWQAARNGGLPRHRCRPAEACSDCDYGPMSASHWLVVGG